MESGPSHPSNINTTCMTPESRALCAICGAPAIGKKTNFFESLFKLFSYVKGAILMHTLVYHVKVINRISLRQKNEAKCLFFFSLAFFRRNAYNENVKKSKISKI